MAVEKENKPKWSYITMNGCWKGNKAQVRIKQWMDVENANKPQLSYITMSGCWKGE